MNITIDEVQTFKSNIATELDKQIKLLTELIAMATLISVPIPAMSFATTTSVIPTKTKAGRLPRGYLENIIMELLSTDIKERKFRSDWGQLAKKHEAEGVKVNSIEQAVERLILSGKIQSDKFEHDNYKRSFWKN